MSDRDCQRKELDELVELMADVEEAAEERMEVLMAGLLRRYPTPDKGKDQLAWAA